ncbi:hypothetical protein [uncultured Hoeflea sp.]|uniref:hypothetical protein n=1 Tax=uncultured Hoeflea sp. TaxID=538666 RepID=UPI002606646A|nr:hypothetical protein [uncultured Hoeflea sp.]
MRNLILAFVTHQIDENFTPVLTFQQTCPSRANPRRGAETDQTDNPESLPKQTNKTIRMDSLGSVLAKARAKDIQAIKYSVTSLENVTAKVWLVIQTRSKSGPKNRRKPPPTFLFLLYSIVKKQIMHKTQSQASTLGFGPREGRLRGAPWMKTRAKSFAPAAHRPRS